VAGFIKLFQRNLRHWRRNLSQNIRHYAGNGVNYAEKKFYETGHNGSGLNAFTISYTTVK
jgi:hypothetical protein